MRKLLLNLLVIVFYVSGVFAEIHPNAGKTSANFLKLPVSANMSVLGNNAGVVSDEVSSVYANPSSISSSEGSYLEFFHNEYLQGIKHNFVGYRYKTKNGYLTGFGIVSLFADGIEARSGILDMDDRYVNLYQVTQPDYYYGVLDIAVSGFYSKKLNEKFSVGSTVKVISQKIDTYSGATVGMDFGVNYLVKDNFFVGGIIKNLGLPLKIDKESYMLPLELSIGGYYKYLNSVVMLNLSQPIDEFLAISVAVEYNFLDYLFLRGGCKYKIYGWELGEDYLTGLSAGVGIRFSGVRVDYGVISYGTIGLSHSISVGMEVDKAGNFYKKLREKFSKKVTYEVKKESEVKKEIVVPLQQTKQTKQDVSTSKEESYTLKVRLVLEYYESINKIFSYRFESASPIEFENGKFLLEKVEGKIGSRKKLPVEKEMSMKIERSKNKEAEEDKLEIVPCEGEILSNVSLYFLANENVTLEFLSIDRSKIFVEDVMLNNKKVYKINSKSVYITTK